MSFPIHAFFIWLPKPYVHKGCLSCYKSSILFCIKTFSVPLILYPQSTHAQVIFVRENHKGRSLDCMSIYNTRANERYMNEPIPRLNESDLEDMMTEKDLKVKESYCIY